MSNADTASATIGEQLLDLAEWEREATGVFRRPGFELREFDRSHLHLESVADRFEDPEFVVVASKHSGETGPLLSAHFTGNFGEAEYGGSTRELSDPAPNALRRVLSALDDRAPDNYDVAMECTHHGPTDLGGRGLFVELGSDPEQWTDQAGAKAVAEAILQLEGVDPTAGQTLVAFGGNHYAPRPTRILRETDFRVGHVAADWSLSELGNPEQHRALLDSMFQKSNATRAFLDGEHPAVEAVVEDMGYRIVSETWVRETSGADPELVNELETALGTVESGLRLGAVDPGSDPFLIVDLPSGLVAECQGIDAKATVEAVSRHSIAYQTTENGNRVGSRAALAEDGAYEGIVEALESVLASPYDAVRRESDTIVAERSSFDPEKAAARGVPEGPKFGELAAGKPVTVDGETVEPEDVHSTEIRRFEV